MDIPTRKGQHILDAAQVSQKIAIKWGIPGSDKTHYLDLASETAVRNCPRCKGDGYLVNPTRFEYAICSCLGI